MYERILIAYDGSPEGLIALREGALLARRDGAALTLISVLADTPAAVLIESFDASVLGERMARCEATLVGGVKELESLGLAAVPRLAFGDPAAQIAQAAREVEADLVVLGHQQRNLLQRWWSDGVGAYVANHVSASVLIARHVLSDAVIFSTEPASAEGGGPEATAPPAPGA